MPIALLQVALLLWREIFLAKDKENNWLKTIMFYRNKPAKLLDNIN